MVIPVAGGAVVIALADLALAFCLLTAGLLAIAIVYWLFSNARGRLGGLPIIGGALVNAINLMLATTLALAGGLTTIFQLQFYYAVHNLRLVLNYFLAPVFMSLMTMTQNVANRVWDYDHNAFPRIAATFVSVWEHIRYYDFEAFPLINLQLTQLFNDAALLQTYITQLFTRVEGLASRVWDYDHNAFPRIAARFAADAAALAELQAFLPLLRTLAEFERGTVRGFEGVRADVDVIRDLVRQHSGQLAVLGALTILATAGATTIRELRCIGGLKCDPLSALLQGDIDERVTALEVDHG